MTKTWIREYTKAWDKRFGQYPTYDETSIVVDYEGDYLGEEYTQLQAKLHSDLEERRATAAGPYILPLVRRKSHIEAWLSRKGLPSSVSFQYDKALKELKLIDKFLGNLIEYNPRYVEQAHELLREEKQEETTADLQKRLDKLLAAENYEEAAKIRDLMLKRPNA